VEGKVSEPFGSNVKDWFKNKTPGKEKRLRFLCNELGLDCGERGQIMWDLAIRNYHEIANASVDIHQIKC